MQRKLQKIGNSYMVTIPARFVKDAGWKEGYSLDVEMKNEELVIKPEKKRKKKLSDLKIWGSIHIPDFDFERSMQLIREAGYDR